MEESLFKEHEDEISKIPLSEFSPSEASATMAEYILHPSVPESERAKFADWSMLLSNMSVLSNLERHERLELIMGWRMICMLMNWGDYRTAHEYMGEMLFELMISRSVDATGLIYGLQGINAKSIDYNTPSGEKRKVQKGLVGRIAGMLKGDNKK